MANICITHLDISIQFNYLNHYTKKTGGTIHTGFLYTEFFADQLSLNHHLNGFAIHSVIDVNDVSTIGQIQPQQV